MKATEIDAKLQADFKLRRSQYGEPVDQVDPILRAIFLTFSNEIADLYSNTDAIHLGFLDQLMSGLGVDPRTARAAQTIVRLLAAETAQIPGGTPLQGQTDSGLILPFLTDESIVVSGARIAAAFSYQEDRLQLLGGVDTSDSVRALKPSIDPVPAKLGPHSAVYIAVENLPGGHLGQHGLFFDLSPRAASLHQALKSAVWCLADPEGAFVGNGLLRPRRGNAGVEKLEWLATGGGARLDAPESETRIPDLPDGFYAGRVFTMPAFAMERQWQCGCPLMMEPPLRKVFGETGYRAFIASKRAWLRISLPPGIGTISSLLNGILLHAISASNIECLNQTLNLAADGLSIPVSAEAGGKGYLVAPCSIADERNAPYLPMFQASQDRSVGRYSIAGGKIVLQPAKSAEGVPDKKADVCLWLTGGKLGNTVGSDRVTTPASPSLARNLRVLNPTAASGGTNGESYSDARARFAAALLSRDRIVTRSDIETAVHMFDHRIRTVTVQKPELVRSQGGLQRAIRIVATFPEHVFVDQEEIRVLRDELNNHLRSRALHDTLLTLEIVTT